MVEWWKKVITQLERSRVVTKEQARKEKQREGRWIVDEKQRMADTALDGRCNARLGGLRSQLDFTASSREKCLGVFSLVFAGIQ